MSTANATTGWPAQALYGATIFAGVLVLGWVVLPIAGIASGAFASDADAQAFFSFATLKGIPYLLGASVLSVLFQPFVVAHRWPARLGLTGLNVLVAWAIAAAIAIARLG